jgi:hypothetical protein
MNKGIVTLILLAAAVCRGPVASGQVVSPDTTFYLVFNVKMAKVVKDGIFNPATDSVFVVLDQGITPVQLVPGAGNVYSGLVGEGVDSGRTYNYHYRINDTLNETVSRTVVPAQGTIILTDWWNNDPLNVTTFNVDMTYQVAAGNFDPAKDSLDVVGSMNSGVGSPNLQRIDTSLVYQISMELDPGTVYQYRFRIDRDPFNTEFLAQSPRYLRAPDTLITLNLWYDDENPAMVPMTFRCNLEYLIRQGAFMPDSDYLDVAGNFNNQGAYDLLYQRTTDSTWSATMLFDTAQIGGSPLEFKFRINGNWTTAELENEPYRTYTLHQPSEGNPNVYTCWYNNLDPTVPAPPVAYNLFIQGAIIAGSTVTGSYAYEDMNGIPEGVSLYQWYLADSLNAVPVAIDTATKINYTIDSLSLNGKYLVFQVTPVAQSGDSAVGNPVRVWSDYAIGGVGIPEQGKLAVRCYPNPAEGFIFVESAEPSLDISLAAPSGQHLSEWRDVRPGKHLVPLDQLAPGMYFLILRGEGGRQTVFKLLKK